MHRRSTSVSPVLGTPGDSTSAFARPYRTVTIGMVALVALTAFEALAVTTAMPVVVRALGGLGLYATAFAGPMASGIVGMVAGGTWSDRFGPARPLYAGVGLFVAGLLVAGTATTMLTVVGGRIVQGLGSGMLTVALYVVVARVFPDAVQPRVLAAFAAAWVLPAVVGPAIAGAVAESIGWRWVFLAVPLGAVPALLLLRPALRAAPSGRASSPAGAEAEAVGRAAGASAGADGPAGGGGATTASGAARRSEARQDRGADAKTSSDRGVDGDRRRLARATGAGLGLLALQLAGQSDGVRVVVLVGVGAALLGATVPRLLPRGTLRAARGIPAVIALRGLVAAAFFGAEVYLPLLLTTERDLSPSRAGLALTVGAVTWSTGSWLRGRAEGRRDDRVLLRLGAVCIASGVGLAALAVWPPFPVAAAILGWGAAGFGMGLSYPTLSLLTLRLSAPSEQGLNTSALQLNESMSCALVLAVSGPVFAALVVSRPTEAFLVCFGASLLLALGAVVVAGRVRPVGSPAAATAGG